MAYTIKKLANMAKVSVRTLHYYDEIGLLKPSFVEENGYRYYEKDQLLLLQQILFYRELDFPLEEIKIILEDPSFDLAKALREQKIMISAKKARYEGLLKTIEKTIKDIEGKDKMKDEEIFGSFSEKQKEYQKEAEERWGGTDAYKQSIERTKKMTKDDWEKYQKEAEDILVNMVANMDKDIESDEIQALIKRHWAQINQFYDCSAEIYCGLAEMYIADERFADHYRKYHQDLPEFLSRAMKYYCLSIKK